MVTASVGASSRPPVSAENVGASMRRRTVGSCGGAVGVLGLSRTSTPTAGAAEVDADLVDLAHVALEVGQVTGHLVVGARPAEGEGLEVDQVGDDVLDRPAGAAGGRLPLVLAEVGAHVGDRRPRLGQLLD